MRVKRHYEGAVFQFVVTAVLVCNFFVTIAESNNILRTMRVFRILRLFNKVLLY
jgi:hypothetical protein